ncbi:hypothetical protein FALBO_10584 [Fusarium albosuccineum]|uniref:Arrestin-like N-terminal domain-containing protein n=1 Tax=Fusarium albosuccineum TaxID=1237068 RepID=A0A8H4PAW1_9HYPO|nr:hypothetical protein FALBO_10584 [Fusarium albosuccineum]
MLLYVALLHLKDVTLIFLTHRSSEYRIIALILKTRQNNVFLLRCLRLSDPLILTPIVMEPPYAKPQDIIFRRQHLSGPWIGGTVCNPFKALRSNELEITINQHFASKRYSSGSQVKGDVIIKPQRDIPFDRVSIKFICESSVETNSGDLPVETSHLLLDIDMPISPSVYPEPRAFHPGESFSIPFEFTIPARLGTAPCAHTLRAEGLRDLHSQAPPSTGCWERDSMAPKGIKIEYTVQATLWSSSTEESPAMAMLGSKQPIQVLPCGVEHGPLVVPHMNPNYCLKSSKRLRTALFSRATGQLTLSADQPRAIQLKPSGCGVHPTTLAAKIVFQPFQDNSSPPDNCNISVRLESETWFRDRPMNDFPNLVGQIADYSVDETLLTKASIPLSWEISSSERRESNASSDQQSSIPYWSTIEVELPSFTSSERIFLPTFYSCLSSRTYKLRVTVHIGSTSLLLALPVQLLLVGTTHLVPNEYAEESLNTESAVGPTVRLPSYDELHGHGEGSL